MRVTRKRFLSDSGGKKERRKDKQEGGWRPRKASDKPKARREEEEGREKRKKKATLQHEGLDFTRFLVESIDYHTTREHKRKQDMRQGADRQRPTWSRP